MRNFVDDVMDRALILRRPRVAIFADTMKIVIIFVKTLKPQEKLKELEIMYQNPVYICIS